MGVKEGLLKLWFSVSPDRSGSGAIGSSAAPNRFIVLFFADIAVWIPFLWGFLGGCP